MSQKRRGGGGFRPPELRGTLGTLLRTTLHQAGVVRDAAREALGQGRARLDDALSNRRRTDALAELGELVLDLIRRGEIDLGELPEARDLVRRLDDLDASTDDHDLPDEIATPPSRQRFDTRTRDADDGTVASGARWAPPKATRPAGERVWRPPVEDHDAEPPAAPARTPAPAARKGGISFEPDDDSDLAEYMHPDDVPPKPDPTE